MFDDINRFPKSKIKLYFKYLVNAASKLPIEPKVTLRRDIGKNNPVTLRLAEFTPERREELETRIAMADVKEKFYPQELKIRKLKEKIQQSKKEGKLTKQKYTQLMASIRRCELMMGRVKSN